MSHFINSLVNSYKERQAKNNLKIAVRSALGSSMNFDNYNDFLNSTENDKDIANSLKYALLNDNLNERYSNLLLSNKFETSISTKNNITNNNKNNNKIKSKNKKNEKFKKNSNNLKLKSKNNFNNLLFFSIDENLLSNDEKSNNSLIGKKAEIEASNVYFNPSLVEGSDPKYIGGNINTLKLVYAMDNIYSLSKFPSSYDLKLLIKNQNFLNHYNFSSNNDKNNSKNSVTFNNTILTKTYNKTQIPNIINPNIKNSEVNTKIKKILKNDKNTNYIQEIEIAQYCDQIDIVSFLRLLDNSMKSKLRKHELMKFNKTKTI